MVTLAARSAGLLKNVSVRESTARLKISTETKHDSGREDSLQSRSSVFVEESLMPIRRKGSKKITIGRLPNLNRDINK